MPHVRSTSARRPTVDTAPVGSWLRPFLCIFAPWSLVIVGRRVCLVAQRVPACVALVRLVVRYQEHRRAHPGPRLVR